MKFNPVINAHVDACVGALTVLRGDALSGSEEPNSFRNVGKNDDWDGRVDGDEIYPGQCELFVTQMTLSNLQSFKKYQKYHTAKHCVRAFSTFA